MLLAAALLAVTLVQNAQAFYNPSTGRWLNRDPIGELGHELLKEHSESFSFAGEFGFDEGKGDEREIPESTFMNLYGFVGNDPIYAVDPNGEAIWVPVVVVGCRIAVTGYRAYQTLKKARKAQAAVCDAIWAGYQTACGTGCFGSKCEEVAKIGYPAMLACVEGRELYLKLRCDDVGGGYGYKGKLDPRRNAKRKAHEGQLATAKVGLENCRQKLKRLCGSCPIPVTQCSK